ncbi:MAG TPA: SCO family protein [Gammaproteobacteria bacterium]
MVTMRKLNRGTLVAAGLCLALATDLRAQEADPHAGHAMDAAAHESADFGNIHGIEVDFELLDRDGNLVRDEDFRGKHVLLGFGFTHCAHICPMMALNMGKALSMAEIDAVGIFVSVDTERDTPARTDDYASNFGERMLGLGGSFEQINVAAANFKVSYAVTKTQNNYTVQHTANVYVIDPEGDLVDVLTFSTAPEDLLAAMQ